MEGFTKLLGVNKLLSVDNFHQINIKVICQELHQQIMLNYIMFAE